ncbi:PREDICTED: uncharacterized protein LOC106811728 [Priapulus caudatus]|uniref:Uncharacterized protein LOC106811728 n=1 Tax=Priapulus caudatus TaxID=37621 RepID=A0ABM1EFF0_PRICU|nr:PREDICTED: uncharacterized protein LOC106811728 [Priapulus caudatus]
MSSNDMPAREPTIVLNRRLLLAAASGHTDTVTTLLTAGASLEAGDDDGFTALILAAGSGHTDTVTVLITAGANLEVADKDGCTALMLAAGTGHTDTVTLLITAGANLEVVDYDGYTALMVAVVSVHSDTVTVLASAGASLEAANKDGCTALILAASSGHTDTVTTLVKCGASLEAADNDDCTALMTAVGSGHTDAVMILVTAGASLEASGQDGYTALILAASGGHSDIVARLVTAGANLEAVGHDGWTALVCAVDHGHTETVTVLLAASARQKSAQLAYQVSARRACEVTLNDGYRKAAGELLSYLYLGELESRCYCDVEATTSRNDVNSVTSRARVRRVRSLTDVWELEGVGRLRHPEECAQIRLAVLELMGRVSEEISAADPEFSCKPVLVGSTANRTKAGLPDEYDFMFELDKFTGNVLIEETDTPGIVRVRDCHDCKCLLVDLKEQFVQVLCPAMASVMHKSASSPLKFSRTSRPVEWNKVCTQFNLVYAAGDAYKNLSISVDITPSIQVSGKPAGATDRFPVDYHYHVVPKPVVGSDEYWSVCSAKAESLLITGFPQIYRQALIVVKALLDAGIQDYDEKIRNLANDNNLRKNVEVYRLRLNAIDIIRLFIATRSKPKSLIDSYFLKLALLHVYSIMSSGDSSSHVKLSEIVRELFMFIETCQTKGELKHPLIPSIDVLAEDKGKLIEHVPAGYLRMKAVKAVLARLDDGPLVSNSGLLHLSAEEVWQQMEESVRSAWPDEVELVHGFLAEAWDFLRNTYEKAE